MVPQAEEKASQRDVKPRALASSGMLNTCTGYSYHPTTYQQVYPLSHSSLIVMMEATEDRKGHNFARATT